MKKYGSSLVHDRITLPSADFAEILEYIIIQITLTDTYLEQSMKHPWELEASGKRRVSTKLLLHKVPVVFPSFVLLL